MATLPTRKLEVEFDAGVWTDITADMVDVQTRRGRNKESGAYEAGTMTFTVRNDTRKYDPDYAAGTYYGKLRPNRRARLRATYSAVTYDLFLGYIDRISQVYGGPNEATAEFQVTDGFKILNRVELPESVYRAEVAATGPVSFWPLDEPDTATVVTDVIGGRNLTVNGVPGFGAAGLVVRDPGAAMTIDSSVGEYLARVDAFPVTGTPLSLELWYQHTPAASTGYLGGFISADEQNGAILQTLSTDVKFTVMRINGGVPVSGTLTTTGVTINDGSPHHIVGTWAGTGDVKVYVDGVSRGSGSLSVAAGTFTTTTGYTIIPSAGAGASNGTYQMFAIYNTALDAATVATHNTAGRTPWNGDLPGARLTRIATLAGATPTSFDTGVQTLQATDLGGTALDYVQKVEETDAGHLFITADGTLRYLDRVDADTGAYLTSKFTLVDDDSGAGIPYRTTSADVDEARIVTRATTSREGSVAVTYSDATAVAEFQLIDEVHDGLLHDSDAYSLYYSQWVVNTHKTPSSRIGTVTLELTKDPANMYPALLPLELADRVIYKRKPQNTGTTISVDMRVEAISHDTGPHYWRSRLQLSPFNLGEGGWPVFVWDVTRWDQHVWGL